MVVSLPTRLTSMPARLESLCPVCGILMLPGDLISGPFGAGARSWCHRACVPTLYRFAGRPAPRLVDVGAPALDLEPRPSHAAVNRADAPRCYACGRRIILGRDGAPVPSRDGRRVRHEACRPATVPAGGLPCGHRAVYKGGPLAGECRACHRAAQREASA